MVGLTVFGLLCLQLFGLVVSVLLCRRARPGDYCGVRTAPLEVRHRDDHHRDDRDDRHHDDRNRDDRYPDDRHRDDRNRDDRHRDDRHRDDRHRDDRAARQERDTAAPTEKPRQPVYCERSSDGWFS